jgi:hypothetical protein
LRRQKIFDKEIAENPNRLHPLSLSLGEGRVRLNRVSNPIAEKGKTE